MMMSTRTIHDYLPGEDIKNLPCANINWDVSYTMYIVAIYDCYQEYELLYTL